MCFGICRGALVIANTLVNCRLALARSRLAAKERTAAAAFRLFEAWRSTFGRADVAFSSLVMWGMCAGGIATQACDIAGEVFVVPCIFGIVTI